MIVKNDENALRKKCEPVFLEEVDSLISTLEKELSSSEERGIGLAANQVGIQKFIAIVRIPDQEPINLINCKIAKSYDKFLFKDEGCLSFKNIKVDTERYNEIYVVDNLTYPHSFIANGLTAVAIQHELDHLNGIIIMDREVKKITKQPPNELCLCGSLKKHKKCCALKGNYDRR